MATKTSKPEGRNDIPSKADTVIQDLSRAQETCGIPPAQVTFASVSDLLTMTGVRSIPSCGNEPPVDGHSELRGPSAGLRRYWVILRRCVSSPRPGAGWETVG